MNNARRNPIDEIDAKRAVIARIAGRIDAGTPLTPTDRDDLLQILRDLQTQLIRSRRGHARWAGRTPAERRAAMAHVTTTAAEALA
jgi:hypothetical protein